MNLYEFFHRWNEGIQKITPLQMTFQQLIGQVIVLIGIIVGLVVTFYYKQWWIFVILIGSFIVAGTSLIGVWQKYRILRVFMQPAAQEKKEVGYVN